jgi:biopolymer transport protein ExbB/TolQ
MNLLLDMGKIQARLVLAASMLVLSFVAVILISSINDKGMKVLLLDYGTSYYPFTIQNFMWGFFFLGIGELLYRFVHARYTLGTLKMRLLPEADNEILTKKETRELFSRIKDQSQLADDIPSILKKLILHFQTADSISQTHALFSSRMDLKYNQMDTDYSMIRYLTWVIPTFGFIGTVIGIAMALSFAANSDPQAAKFLSGLTEKLGVAFYTTLVGLVMSAILVFLMHIVQSYEEGSLFRAEEYVLDNFINRLYIP